jgi:hypothetical protein
MIFTDTLYACDIADAPDYRWKNQIAVHRICSFHSDLSGISLAKFPKVKRSNGKEYYEILFELKMTVLNEVSCEHPALLKTRFNAAGSR